MTKLPTVALMALAAIQLATACKTPEEKAVAELKQCAQYFAHNKETLSWVRNVTFDVQKTDSLVSPIIGFVQCDTFDDGSRMRIVLAYQNGRWVVQGLSGWNVNTLEWGEPDADPRTIATYVDRLGLKKLPE